MFTVEDIRDIAVQIERNGEAAYQHAAENTNHPEIAKLFRMMATDEHKHIQWFEKMSTLEPPVMVEGQDPQIVQMGRELLQNMMAQQTFSLQSETLAKVTNIFDALRQSVEFEKDTILFYEMLSDFLDDRQTMRQLELIISEERTHIEKLNEIIKMLEAENQTAF
ncbi:MAG: ferritin family protein [Desulfobacteraceae bacterium]|nr:ferritin family protein [Desulfobacteraceae bacterium]